MLPSPTRTDIQHVLVLGSTGLVGSALTSALQQAGYTVHQVRHRYDADLRLPGSLDRFNNTPIDFAFFLACEVGGSKFLHAPGVQERIWLHNVMMYDTVFPYLTSRRIPFLFSSSMHSALNSTYGRMKLDGERRVLNPNSTGKVAKFWNVYGYEKIGMRSHVLSDWLYECASGKSKIQSITDGQERKQFLHADDMALALIGMMAEYASLAPVTDVSTGQWVSMRELALVVATVSGGTCEVEFSQRQAPVMAEPEPNNLWRVDHDAESRLRQMLDRYKADVVKERTWRTRDDLYLSVIVATSNDDYNGIRQRMFTFVHHFAALARQVHLDYELIAVQYNPRLNADYFGTSSNASSDDELPLSALIPLTPDSATARLRIVTVSPELHVHAEKGRVWEYVAKNVGVRRARGRFVLLTNPDNLFPQELLGWISKEILQDDVVLLAHIILNFDPAWPSDMQRACDVAGTSIAFCGWKDKGRRCRSRRNVHGSLAAAGWGTGGQAFDLNPRYGTHMRTFVGDCSVWSRDAFLGTGGYLETYQNEHVETAHSRFVASMKPPPVVAWVHADDALCHRVHDRKGRPQAGLTPELMEVWHANRTDAATWGLAQHNLPNATAGHVLDHGYNPLTPHALYRHHPVFEAFAGRIAQAPFDDDALLDFVGTVTQYKFDCEDRERYRRFHLSRRIPCNRHDAFVAMQVGSYGIPVLGDMPVMDEEYFEWVSLLQAVTAYADHASAATQPRPFVIAEFGARYGTWTARGVRAALTLVPLAEAHVCAVEGDPMSYKWMMAHLERNVPPSLDHFVLHGVVANHSNTVVPALRWEADTIKGDQQVPTVTVIEALAKYAVVDIVHMDIQAAEIVCLSSNTTTVFNSKVKAMHIGTHTVGSHNQLRAHFQAAGWDVQHDVVPNGGIPPGRIEHTEYGPINFYWDGELRVVNQGLKGA